MSESPLVEPPTKFQFVDSPEFIAAQEKRRAQAAEWKKDNEHQLRWKVSGALWDAGIPHVTEYRCADGGDRTRDYYAVDIAVFVKREFRDALQPLLAVELKNTDSRDDAMRGAGQCLTYRGAGFPKAMLVTSYFAMGALENGLYAAGIEVCEPHSAARWITEIYRDAGGFPVRGGFKYEHPITAFSIPFSVISESENCP